MNIMHLAIFYWDYHYFFQISGSICYCFALFSNIFIVLATHFLATFFLILNIFSDTILALLLYILITTRLFYCRFNIFTISSTSTTILFLTHVFRLLYLLVSYFFEYIEILVPSRHPMFKFYIHTSSLTKRINRRSFSSGCLYMYSW